MLGVIRGLCAPGASGRAPSWVKDFTGARGGGDGAVGRGRGGNAGFFSFSSVEGGDICRGEVARLLSEAAGAIGKVLDLFGRGGGGRPRDAVEFKLGEGDGDDLKAAS